MIDIDIEVNTDALRKLVDIVGTVVDEARLEVKKEGITIEAMDAAQVGMVEVNLWHEIFEKYDIEEGVIGLKLSKLDDFLKIVGTDTIIKMKNDGSRLLLKYEGLEHRISTIDVESINESSIPDLDLDNAIEVEAGTIKMGVSATQNISDHLKIKADYDDKSFEMFSNNETDDASLTLYKYDLVTEKIKKHTKASYALDYFSDFVSCVDNDNIVRLEFDQDYPILMEYNFSDGLADVTVMLAPRIEAEA